MTKFREGLDSPDRSNDLKAYFNESCDCICLTSLANKTNIRIDGSLALTNMVDRE